MAKTRGAK